jgi:hypothetical protein
MSLTDDDIKKLKRPFPDETIGVKVNNFSKDRTKAMLIQYLQHTDVYDRIEEVDPTWSCMAGTPFYIAKVIAVPMKLSIKGVTRENIGEGEDYKSAYSDALKRAAMLFGIGRYLYDAEQVWVSYNEQTDKYKKWTIEDFNKNKKKGPVNENTSNGAKQNKESASADAKPPGPAESNPAPKTGGGITEPQRKRLFAIGNKHGWNQERIKKFIKARFAIDSTKELTRFNYDFLITQIENSKVE